MGVLLSRRARCSYHLMNYVECIEDCHAAWRCWIASPRGGSPALVAVARDEMCTMVQCWLRTLALREEYTAATQLTEHVLSIGVADVLFPSVNEEARVRLMQQQKCLQPVQRFRECATEQDWRKALGFWREAEALVKATPLEALAAAALLSSGLPDEAREALVAYLPTITSSDVFATVEGTAVLAPEERVLLSRVQQHYTYTTLLLAKASVYCGPSYMNIAAVLTQRCLYLDPHHAPALTFASYLLGLERQLSVVEQCCHESRLDIAGLERAVAGVTKADPRNARVIALLHLRRGEALLRLGRPLKAIDACSESIQLDSSSATAYATRARAYAAAQLHVAAASDRAEAVGRNPSYEAIFRAEDRNGDAGRWRSGSGTAGSTATRLKDDHPRASFSPQGPRSHSSKAQAAPPPRCTVGAMKTLYDLLEVTPAASAELIRQQYRRLTLRLHPDKLIGVPEKQRIAALEQFKRVNNAHSILSDASARAAYDEELFSTRR